MYHSVSFFTYDSDTSSGGKNTWASWRLIPSSRPFIAPPTQKTVYEEVPFANGKLDFSEFGVSDSVFDNREGSFEFTAINNMIDGYVTGYSKALSQGGNKLTLMSMYDNKLPSSATREELNGSPLDWDQEYSEIMSSLHGERRKIVLEDDPSFYYIGRTEVETTNSEENYTTYTIKYDVWPFKKARFSTGAKDANGKPIIEKLPWDAIDFEANLDTLGLCDVTVSKGDSFVTTFKTLRETIRPTITVSASSNNQKQRIAELRIKEDSHAERRIYLNPGTNKIYSAYRFDGEKTVQISTVDCLRFRGMTNNLTIKIFNLSSGTLTFTLDYCLEGF